MAQQLITMAYIIRDLKQLALWFVLAFFLTLAFPSCNVKTLDEDDTDNFEIEYIPVRFEKNGLWSLVSRKGEIKYQNAFKNEPTCVINGIFTIEDDNEMFTVCNINSDIPTPIKSLSNLKQVGYINEGLLPICYPGKRISVVNKKGVEQFVLNPINGAEIEMCSNHFSDGMLWICDENDKCGFVNTKGECVILPIYENCGNFSEGKALVLIDSVWRVIDKSGRELFVMEKDLFPDFTNRPACETGYEEFKYNRICVTDRDFSKPDQEYHYYMYDGQGNMTQLSSEIKSIVDYDNTNIIYNSFSHKAGDKYFIKKDNLFDKGLITLTGEIVINPIYETLVFLSSNELLGRNIEKPVTDEGWEIIDAAGNTIYNLNYTTTGIQYNNIQYIPDFGLIGSIAGKSYYGGTIIQKNGKPVNADLYFEQFGTKKSPRYFTAIESCYSTSNNF
ncbi:MAG: WG repeat-containing protein [Treponema sp.]|nr:WG repeat-containing protein [Treponema sp.]